MKDYSGHHPHLFISAQNKHIHPTMKRILTLLILPFTLACHAFSQNALSPSAPTTERKGVFKDLSLGVSASTDGLGLDISTHITSYVRLRTGVDYMPRFTVPMTFGLQGYTEEGNPGMSDFEKMQRYMKRLTGFDVDDRVSIEGEPRICNFKLLVDVFPFKGKHGKNWYLTAGFFWGKSKIASARNTIEEMPSLLAVSVYNNFYDYFMETDFYETPIYGDIYLDPFLVEDIREDLTRNGHLGIRIGDRNDGTPYYMVPDTDGMVKANAFANAFKPYLGFGHTTPLGGKDSRFNFSLDCGVMFWGGSPNIITHDGTNLNKLAHVRGKIGNYVDIAKSLKVYPMIGINFSYSLCR